MKKNIILLSDGTGNGAAKRNKTNVWRLFDVLDLHRDDQVAFYDDGVGSQEFLPFKLLGGAFGWGLKRNVRELYKFLCRNYNEGDRIYLFGFSRGAFTVRMLAGMIDYCGVYNDSNDEQILDEVARHNYNAFRSSFGTGLLTKIVRIFFGKKKPIETKQMPHIEFIGVWDTVDAYGFPIDELAIIWNYLIYPIHFPDYKLSSKVKKACHALSVDDERHTFHPVLWDESGETDPERIEQVWFPGVHSDVGGGYPKYNLALVALDWMIAKAEALKPEIGSPGLHLIMQRREAFIKHSDWHGHQHDSRAMAGAYYRYKPRDIEKLCNNEKNGVLIKIPKIHRSVMERIAGNVIPYAPTGIPEKYKVVATRGSIPVYETPEQSRLRKEKLEPVKKIITGRRLLYLANLLTTLGFLATPVLFGCFSSEQCTSTSGFLDPLLELGTRILPDFTAPWIKVLRDSPGLLYALMIVFICLSLFKAKAWSKTQAIATAAWEKLKNKDKRIIDEEGQSQFVTRSKILNH